MLASCGGGVAKVVACAVCENGGVAATHHAVLERIGARALTQAITAAQKARLNCFGYQKSYFIFYLYFKLRQERNLKWKSCKD